MVSYVDKEQIDNILYLHGPDIEFLYKILKEKSDYSCGIYHQIVMCQDNAWRRSIVLVKQEVIILDEIHKTHDTVRFTYNEFELIYKEISTGIASYDSYRKLKDILILNVSDDDNTPIFWDKLPDVGALNYIRASN